LANLGIEGGITLRFLFYRYRMGGSRCIWLRMGAETSGEGEGVLVNTSLKFWVT